MKWIDNNIEIEPCKNPKKITGTRFAAILGSNKWSTPFEIWCAITRTYEKPFEDTKYTIAGKTIEPKQADFIEDTYFFNNLVRPSDYYGENYFSKTRGDFFHENSIFGGMWDYLFVDADRKVASVLEMKTTKRAEDWEYDIPEYYALQAALYGYLLEVDDIIMVCTVLKDSDYDHPEDFDVNTQNTFERRFKISERYPNFEELIEKATEWWNYHVIKGISPDFDEKADAEILKELRKNNINPTTQVEELIKEAESLKNQIDSIKESYTDLEKRYKKVTEMIKQIAMEQFRDGDKEVVFTGSDYAWTTSRSVSKKLDEDLMRESGIELEEYMVEKESYRFTPKKIKK